MDYVLKSNDGLILRQNKYVDGSLAGVRLGSIKLNTRDFQDLARLSPEARENWFQRVSMRFAGV